MSLCVSHLYAQKIGLPFIYNYTKKLKFYKTVWQIKQAPNGILYMATEDGIYEYDGHKINKILTKPSIFFSLDFNKKGDIFFGSTEAIGQIYLDSAKWQIKYFYYDFPINSVWTTQYFKGHIYFLINNHNLIYLDNNKLYTIKSSKYNMHLFKVNNHLFLISKNTIYDIIGNKVFEINRNFKITDQDIRIILPYDSTHYLVGTKLGNFYITDITFSSLSVIELQDQQYIRKSIVYKGVKYNDTTFLIATLKGGLIAINKKGKTIFIINDQLGLSDNAIYDILVDKQKNLWLATPNGLCKIIFENFVIGKRNKIKGVIFWSTFIDDNLFVGSSEGLYYTNLNTPNFLQRNIFKPISENLLYPSGFFKCGNYYVGGGYKGLFLFDKNLKLIDTIKTKIFSLYKIDNQSFFISSIDGFKRIKLANNKLKIQKTYPSINSVCIQVYKNTDSSFWINTYNGLFLLIENGAKYSIYFFNINKNSSETEKWIFKLNNELYISMGHRFLKINYNREKPSRTTFKELTELPPGININNIIDNNNSIIKDIIDTKQYIYILTTNKLIYFNKKQHKINFFNFNKLYSTFISNLGQTLFLKYGKLWILTKRYIIIADTILNSHQFKHKLLLKKITLNNKNYYYYKPIKNKTKINKFLPPTSIITFTFVYPDYSHENSILYSYKIDNTVWTDWSENNNFSISKIYGGNHKLYIKVKDAVTEEIYQYEIAFKTKYIWYLSPPAILFYILLSISLSYLYFKTRTLKIKKRNKLLETQIKKRTEILVKQNQKLEKVTEELERQKKALKMETEKLRLMSMELEMLSLVAKYTDNSVVILNEKGKIEWWNRGFTKLFKDKLEQMRDLPFKEKINRLRPKLIEIIKNYQGNKPVVYTTKDEINGKEIWYKTIVNPVFNEDGKIVNFVAIDIDITDIKSAEKAINQQKKLLEEQAEELKLANQILYTQKEQIEQKNYEITSSIEYAKKIQEAILPHKLLFKALFNDYFLIYKPKSIVSGDFYWFDYKNNKAIIVVGDSTGHGVPGAFMSILGITLIKDIIARIEHYNPAEILYELREKLIISLHQSNRGEYTKDGIDMALLIADFETQKLHFSGANSTIFIVNNNKMTVLKGDKMPIGIHDRMNEPFTEHILDLTNDERIYMFSDGFTDQFGGPKDKKYSFKRFKELIEKVSKFPFSKQKHLIEQEFQNWKGDREQTDDIIILGFEF